MVICSLNHTLIFLDHTLLPLQCWTSDKASAKNLLSMALLELFLCTVKISFNGKKFKENNRCYCSLPLFIKTFFVFRTMAG